MTNTDQDEKCFACGRPFRKHQNRHMVDCQDDQTVFVGPDCFKKIKAAGSSGYQPPLGGPRLYMSRPEQIGESERHNP